MRRQSDGGAEVESAAWIRNGRVDSDVWCFSSRMDCLSDVM